MLTEVDIDIPFVVMCPCDGGEGTVYRWPHCLFVSRINICRQATTRPHGSQDGRVGEDPGDRPVLRYEYIGPALERITKQLICPLSATIFCSTLLWLVQASRVRPWQ